MTTTCTASGAISLGDAVCVVSWDGASNRPKVARATAANLSLSKTAYGIARSTAAAGAAVTVVVPGEAFDGSLFPVGSPMLTGTGAGSSHVVATDINQSSTIHQCRLVRVEHPDGSEYVVGTCDEDGNVVVQPRASRDTSQRHVYNVLAYGALADGVNIRDGQMTMGSLTFTTTVSTPFTADDVGRTIVILGALDTGDLVTTIAAYTDPATVTLAAAPQRTSLTATAFVYQFDNEAAITAAVAAMPAAGGTLFFPPSAYAYAVDTDLTIPANVLVWFDEGAILAPTLDTTITIEGRVQCHPNQSIFGNIGHFLLTGAFAQFNVRNFGAVANNVTDDLRAFDAALFSMAPSTSRVGAVLDVPPGAYRLAGTLRIEREVRLRGASTGGGSQTTILNFPAGVTGIIVDSQSSSRNGITQGDRTSIESIELGSEPLALSARPVNGAVAFGTLVYGIDDNRFYFDCVRAGTTGLDTDFFGQDAKAVDYPLPDADGTVVWVPRMHAGVILKTGATVKNTRIDGFTNAGIVLSGTFWRLLPDPPAPEPARDPSLAENYVVETLNADHSQLRDIWISNGGFGVAAYGGDSQVCLALNVLVDTCGQNIPGAGGHGIHDFSAFGNTWIGCGAQGLTGRSILSDGAQTCSVYMGCYTEGDTGAPKVMAPGVLVGGASGSNFDPTSTGLILNPGQSRNWNWRDEAQGTIGFVNLLGSAIAYAFGHDDDQALLGYFYEGASPTGEWSFGYGSARPWLGFLTQTAADGKGNWRDVQGHFLGRNSSEHIFIGPAHARTDKHIRGGFYMVGDQFWLQGTGRAGSFSGWTVKKEGYRGLEWSSSTPYYTDGVAPGTVADLIVPVGTDPDEPAPGTKVFRCIVPGAPGAVEPTWSLAVIVGDTVSEVMSDVVWQYVGDVAEYARIGEIADRGKVTTTDATPTVLATYPIDVSAASYISATVAAMRPDLGGAGTFVVSASWYWDGADFQTLRPVTLDQSDCTGAWTVDLVQSGSQVALTVTGEAGVTINWTAVQKGAVAQ